MAAEVIPLRRVKWIDAGAIAPRLLPVAKTPPKSRELRAERPPLRWAGCELDGVSLLGGLTPSHRTCRASKLRLFRLFKLLDAAKRASPAVAPTACGLRRRRGLSKFA
jgi:hypothetical protein